MSISESKDSIMVLFIKNISIEDPGTFGQFLDQKNIQYSIVDLSIDQQLPKDFSNIEAVVVLGGPMNVDEEDKHPFLTKEIVFIKEVLKRRIPYLGLCLGSQLLAKACGARVGKSPQEEIGFSFVEFNDEGVSDPLLSGLGGVIEVFQWHGDMFEIPTKANLLALSDKCPHQAFRINDNAYGLQFHVEITDKSIVQWTDAYVKDVKKNNHMKAKMISDYQSKKEVFHNTANVIYQNFLNIVEQAKAKV